MTAYPEAQRKAQEEIERVVGRDRLPVFEDRASLPYTDAIFREVLRLWPPTPLIIPRVATEDDVYKGYFIPKGASSVYFIFTFLDKYLIKSSVFCRHNHPSERVVRPFSLLVSESHAP